MAELTQAQRAFSLDTPLGKDRLLLVEASITEHLGEPFTMEIEAIAEEPIRAEELIGKRVTLRLRLADSGERFFNGHVFRISEGEPEERLWPVTLTVRPWLWFLTRTSDCRIFQKQSIPEIIKSIFREHGFTDFEDKLGEEYAPVEFCVQYRETDYNFIQRLLEQEGIYYSFRHEEQRHVLVLMDKPEAHEMLDGEVLYNPTGEQAPDVPTITSFQVERIIQPGRVALNDFNFEKPRSGLETRSAHKRQHEFSDLEIYDYPGEYLEVDAGERYARLRTEVLDTKYQTAHAVSNVATLSAGVMFQMRSNDPAVADRYDGKYLVTSVHHTLTSGGYFSGDPGEDHYGNGFVAIPANTPFRLERKTPRPLIQGPQTALVVGPSGEEIYTDKYGRVKVQFHWDRYGKRDENSSCWIRVAQTWAGKKWGAIHLPRIGQEVIVEFLEGDPDRPIITGRVYNGEQMPPYELPAHKSRSGIKSRSIDGSPSNFNEIRFEDKKGEEEIHIHAERNLRTTVEHDERLYVGNDRTRTVAGNEKAHIKKQRELTVDQDQNIHVKMSHSFKVDLMETLEVGMIRELTVKGGEKKTIEGMGRIETIRGNLFQSISGINHQEVDGLTKLDYNGPVFIKAPAGYTIIAPGGTTIIDNKLTKTGMNIWEGYGSKLDVNMNINEINALKSEAIGTQFSTTGVSGSKTGLELESLGTRWQKIEALALLSEATGIEVSKLRIIF